MINTPRIKAFGFSFPGMWSVIVLTLAGCLLALGTILAIQPGDSFTPAWSLAIGLMSVAGGEPSVVPV